MPSIPNLANEILISIFGYLAVSPSTLHSISLCSHAFNDLVTPILYRTVSLHRYKLLSKSPTVYSSRDLIFTGLSTLSTCSDLPPLVKTLKMEGSSLCKELTYAPRPGNSELERDAERRRKYEKEGKEVLVYEGVKGRKKFREDINEWLRYVVGRCSKLEELEINEVLEISHETLRYISTLPRLRKFSLTFSDVMELYTQPLKLLYDDEQESVMPNHMHPTPGYTDLSLPIFKNLTRLELFELCGDVWLHLSSIVDTLISCRNTLRQLGLSISISNDFQAGPAWDHKIYPDEPPNGKRTVWVKLCWRYRNLTKSLPGDNRLNLKKLHLGFGCFMYPKSSDSDHAVGRSYLSDALKLEELEELTWTSVDDYSEQFGIGWDRLLPAVNMRKLRLDRVPMPDDNFSKFMEGRKGVLEEFDVECDVSFYYLTPEEFEDLFGLVFGEGLKVFKCSPVDPGSLEKLCKCGNLEEVQTRIYGVPWRDAMTSFSKLRKLRTLVLCVSQEVEDTIVHPEEFVEGLDTVELVKELQGTKVERCTVEWYLGKDGKSKIIEVEREWSGAWKEKDGVGWKIVEGRRDDALEQ